MSLTHPFGKCERNNVAYIKTITPSKVDFYSDDGMPCFDKKKPALAPYQLSRPLKATLSGAAFDYTARFLIAEKAKQYKNMALSNLVAEHLYLYHSFAWHQHEEERLIGHAQYQAYIKTLSDLIDKDALLKSDEAVRICVMLAKMEQESRAGREISPQFEIAADDEEIVQDVKMLALAFSDRFLPRIKADSIVIFNPTFGVGSRVVGGADADIFIDGTLYDFKVRKENGWSGELARQLVGYYVIDSIAKDAEDDTNKLYKDQIKRIALYNARFAETDFYDVDRIAADQLESVKAAIRHEYLMRKMSRYRYDTLVQIGVPLSEKELQHCSDDTEIDVEMWQDAKSKLAKEVITAWGKLSIFLKNTDTKLLLREIVTLNRAK